MGIPQARILEWVAIPFPRGSSQPRDWTQVPPITGGFFTIWASREAQEYWSGYPFSRLSSWPRNWSRVSCIAGRFFTSLPPREAPGGGWGGVRTWKASQGNPSLWLWQAGSLAVSRQGKRSDFYLQVIQQPPFHPQPLFSLKTPWYVCLFSPTLFDILGVRATYTFVVMCNWQFRKPMSNEGVKSPLRWSPKIARENNYIWSSDKQWITV